MSRPAGIGVEQERRVHGLAHDVVAAEGERQVRDAAADADTGQRSLIRGRRVDEGLGVAVVLLHAGRDGEHVRVEDDVLGREADLLRQQVVGAAADRDLALGGVGLALLVERHHDDAGAEVADLAGLAQEGLLALLEADRVDDALALHALAGPASSTVHRELSIMIGIRAISGSVAMRFRNVVIACSPSSRSASMLTSSRFAPPRTWSSATSSAALWSSDSISLRNRRAGDVGALTDHHEPGVGADLERLQAAEAGGVRVA